MIDNSPKILYRNALFYNYFLKKKILDVKGDLSDEEVLERIICLVKFAWRNHPGYYFDGRIENILLDYGKTLDAFIDRRGTQKDIKSLFTEKSDYTILHVATELGEVGGHTRVLYQFLKRHEDKNQMVLVTDQSAAHVPKWFIEGTKPIPIVSLSSLRSLFERAFVMRHISGSFQKVISYHHPYDVIPIMALAHDKGPPVIIENHAHSWFWLGPSVSDVVWTHSEFHRDFTLKTRPVHDVHYWPHTQIDDLEDTFNLEQKAEAKKELKISPRTVCVITVGTSEKFVPNGQYNFFKTVGKILERFADVEIFVLGISESLYEKEYQKKYGLDTRRIHFLGFVSDPTGYYKAADICLDALPQPSLGATVFSAIVGMSCPLFKYGAARVFDIRSLLKFGLYNEYIGGVKNENEYLEKLEFLVNNPDIRLNIAAEIRESFFRMSSREAIRKDINEMLELTGNMRHSPGRIPDGVYHDDADSAEIAGMSALQELSGIMDHFRKYVTARDKIRLMVLLSAKPIYLKDIFKLGAMLSKSRIKAKFGGT